jgi:hypothetical protein
MAQPKLTLKHWLALSGVASFSVLTLLAATSTGLANRKTPEDLADLRFKPNAMVIQTEYKDQLLSLNNPVTDIAQQIAELDDADLALDLQEINALKRLIREKHSMLLPVLVVETVDTQPLVLSIEIDLAKKLLYPDLLLRLKTQPSAMSAVIIEKTQEVPADLDISKLLTDINKTQQTRDDIWVARWRLINTLDAALSPASYEAVLFSLLLAHYLQGHLEAGWAEVKVWLEVLVRHGLAEKDALKLRTRLEQTYQALSQ